MYGKNLEVNMDNNFDVLTAASMLQVHVHGLLAKCKSMLKELTEDNYMEIRKLCFKFAMASTVENLYMTMAESGYLDEIIFSEHVRGLVYTGTVHEQGLILMLVRKSDLILVRKLQYIIEYTIAVNITTPHENLFNFVFFWYCFFY